MAQGISALGKPRLGAAAFILRQAATMTGPTTAKTLCQHGLDMLAAGMASTAAHVFRAAIHADPTSSEAQHGLIRALRDAGRIEQAIGAAVAVTDLTPNDPLAFTELSISLQQAGHLPEAEAARAHARLLEEEMQFQTSPDEETLP